jgi:hypothetical protein
MRNMDIRELRFDSARLRRETAAIVHGTDRPRRDQRLDLR